MKKSPLLALTMGDPAGVGPEIIAGAWPFLFANSTNSWEGCSCRPIVLGHPAIIRRAVALRNIEATVIEMVSDNDLPIVSHLSGPKVIPCLNCCEPNVLDIPPGQLDARAGEAAFRCLNQAIDLALEKKINALVTAPLNKKSLHLAGHDFPGHTEILASRCGVSDYAMMLYLGAGENLTSPTGLAVVHVTLHTAMRNAIEQITQEAVVEKCRLIRDFMKMIKGSEPAIGVCALNCHNGEEGLFGREEIDTIRPAVEQVRLEGMNIKGPFPSDTLMVDAKNGKFDGIVAMIHDQGHIAVKMLGMHHAVNVTLGLPIIRTSVAHGTAFDRAWQGTAEITSTIEAVRIALLMANSQGQFSKPTGNAGILPASSVK